MQMEVVRGQKTPDSTQTRICIFLPYTSESLQRKELRFIRVLLSPIKELGISAVTRLQSH